MLLLYAVLPSGKDECIEKRFGKVGGALLLFRKKLLAEASN